MNFIVEFFFFFICFTLLTCCRQQRRVVTSACIKFLGLSLVLCCVKIYASTQKKNNIDLCIKKQNPIGQGIVDFGRNHLFITPDICNAVFGKVVV